MTSAQQGHPDPVSPWDISPLKLLGVIVVVILVGVSSFLGLAFYLASSLTLSSCGCIPYSLGMVSEGSSNPTPGLYYEPIEISPTSGLTTGMFGLKVFTAAGSPITLGAAPTSCAPPAGGTLTAFTVKNCGSSTGNWYAVLVFENTTVQGVFDDRGHWSSPTAPLERFSDQIYIVSGTSYAGVEYTLSAYSVGGGSVSGSCLL
jgi:hypothetical protein